MVKSNDQGQAVEVAHGYESKRVCEVNESQKVGRAWTYQAALRTRLAPFSISRWATSVMLE